MGKYGRVYRVTTNQEVQWEIEFTLNLGLGTIQTLLLESK